MLKLATPQPDRGGSVYSDKYAAVTLSDLEVDVTFKAFDSATISPPVHRP